MTLQRHGQEDSIIPSRSGGVTMLRAHVVLAVSTGLALRLLFALRFPVSTEDSATYIQLARNWADHHVYGLWLNGHLIPTDLRMPGYPAFLAGIAMLLGRSIQAISLSQAALDLCTCFLTAALGAALAPAWARRRVAIAGLWLSATCPFVANYSAAVLTEAPVTFFAAAALLCFVLGLKQKMTDFSFGGRQLRITPVVFACLGGLLAGLATLMRPEMPLLLAVAGVVFVSRWWRPLGWRKVALSGAAVVGAFLLPLIPWAARNFITLHKIQILAPRYATMPGEYAPAGYYAWTNTWLVRYRDVYLNTWKIGEERMDIDDLPSAAFDSLEERTRVASLFDQYNGSSDLDISPEIDHEFAQIARERTTRNSLRTYVRIPLERALTIWFTPRTELLPIDGKFWPISENWEDSPAGFLTTAGFGTLGYLYVALALGGIWVAWRAGRANSADSRPPDSANLWGLALLLAYLFTRTAFLTTVEAPEPRYVVSCYPVVLALAAMLWARTRPAEENHYGALP
jgi:4-amino-4-deoxy-L-arabinose transferase-like glycosyltransferase